MKLKRNEMRRSGSSRDLRGCDGSGLRECRPLPRTREDQWRSRSALSGYSVLTVEQRIIYKAAGRMQFTVAHLD
jgi:hypothetical protein